MARGLISSEVIEWWSLDYTECEGKLDVNGGKFPSIASIGPLYHWNQGNYFLSALKKRMC